MRDESETAWRRAGPLVTLRGVMTQAKASGRLTARETKSRLRGTERMQPRAFQIIFAGQAGTTVRAEFDDCDVSVGPGTTTLRAGLIDQGALQGLMQRIFGLGLELTEVRVVAPPPAQ